MTQSSQNALEALGLRLRDVRKDANLTGRALAELAGWHPSKITRIERGKQTPSEDDLRIWCRNCTAEDQIADMIATVRHIESMYIELRRTMRSGMKRLQESFVPLWEHAKLFRVYEPFLIPGLFQTAEYARSVIGITAERLGVPDDLDEALAARMKRQGVLYTGDRRFLIVIEEQALRTLVGSVEIMAGQLDRLLAVMALQRCSLGIVPAIVPRRTLPSEGFWIYDESKAMVETRSALLTITQPREIAIYAKVFEGLQRSAVYGQQARDLIGKVLGDHLAQSAATS